MHVKIIYLPRRSLLSIALLSSISCPCSIAIAFSVSSQISMHISMSYPRTVRRMCLLEGRPNFETLHQFLLWVPEAGESAGGLKEVGEYVGSDIKVPCIAQCCSLTLVEWFLKASI